MKEYYIKVNFKDNEIETDLNKLVQNDYNSIKINFEIDKEYDSALFELKYPDNSTHQMMIKDNEIILPKGILYQTGDYEFEISIYTSDSKLTHFRTKEFEVREELVTDSEDIINDDKYPVLSDLINQVNKSIDNVEAFKNEIKNDENLRGPQGIQGESYDDTEIKERLTKIEDMLFLKATVTTSMDAEGIVTLNISSNKELQELEGFTLSNDKKSLSKVLNENVGGQVTIHSLDGQELNLTYEAAPELSIDISNVSDTLTLLTYKEPVGNADKWTECDDGYELNVPIGNKLKNSATLENDGYEVLISNVNEKGKAVKTNTPVVVTIKTSKEIETLEGWKLSDDKTIIKKVFIKSNKGTVKIKCTDGSSYDNVQYTVSSMDIVKPKINKVEISDSYTINIILSEYSLINNGIGWGQMSTIIGTKAYSKDDLTDIGTEGVVEVITLKDNYDNINTQYLRISYDVKTDKMSAELIEHLKHEYGENIEVYESTANNTHSHVVKQVCNICKHENIISSISEVCIDSELQNLETDEEHCYIHVKTCTKCGQEIYRDAPEHNESSTPDSLGNIKCTECGKVLRNIGPVLPPLPPLCIHDEYDEGVTAETACSAHLINKTCEICGETYQVKGNHEWDEDNVEDLGNGKGLVYCALCGGTKKITI